MDYLIHFMRLTLFTRMPRKSSPSKHTGPTRIRVQNQKRQERTPGQMLYLFLHWIMRTWAPSAYHVRIAVTMCSGESDFSVAHSIKRVVDLAPQLVKTKWMKRAKVEYWSDESGRIVLVGEAAHPWFVSTPSALAGQRC